MTPRKPKAKHKKASKAAKPTGKKVGRPSLFKPEFVGEVHRLALLGVTDAEMATALGVGLATLSRWKKSNRAFRDALKAGKVTADCTVAHSLFQRAQGFEFDEEQAIKLKEVIYLDGKRVSETERIEIVTVHRVVPPDTTSMIFWLKNRRKDEWRDRREIILSDAELDKMTDEQLQALAEGKPPTGMR